MIVCCRLFLCLNLMPPGVSGVLLKIMLSCDTCCIHLSLCVLILPVFWRIKVFIMMYNAYTVNWPLLRQRKCSVNERLSRIDNIDT